jgi:acyl dehydratase
MPRRYFEDISTGEAYTFGPQELTKQDIIAFAEQYDPQPFHVDETAASESFFGELIASGWHTASVCMRLFVDGLLSDVAVVGALGVDELRWRKPVHAGDELRVAVEVSETEPWDDAKGRVEFDIVGRNQDREVVHSRTDLVLIERRPSRAT